MEEAIPVKRDAQKGSVMQPPFILVFRALFVWRIPKKFLTSVYASNFYFPRFLDVF